MNVFGWPIRKRKIYVLKIWTPPSWGMATPFQIHGQYATRTHIHMHLRQTSSGQCKRIRQQKKAAEIFYTYNVCIVDICAPMYVCVLCISVCRWVCVNFSTIHETTIHTDTLTQRKQKKDQHYSGHFQYGIFVIFFWQTNSLICRFLESTANLEIYWGFAFAVCPHRTRTIRVLFCGAHTHWGCWYHDISKHRFNTRRYFQHTPYRYLQSNDDNDSDYNRYFKSNTCCVKYVTNILKPKFQKFLATVQLQL